MKLEFSRRVSTITQISKYIKILSVGAELFHADGRTDMTKLTAAFRNFSNAPKNQSVNAVWGNNRCLFSDPHKTHKYSVGRAYSC
jgi:hypothetical protein